MTSYLPKILLIGGSGQVGTALRRHSFAQAWQVVSPSHAELDITDLAAIERTILACSPEIVINVAAYTAVDKAEQETELCARINYIGAYHVAHACKKHNLPCIHLSTDYIFSGTTTTPYHEEDNPKPINFYGESKWLGEMAIRNQCEKHIILRVSGIFSEHGNNFFKTILRLAKEKKEIYVVSDQASCPTYADDIAETIFTLAKQASAWGTYHYCSQPPISWYQFALAIIAAAQKYGLALIVEKIHAIPTETYTTPAKRPLYSALDCSKIKKDYGMMQPSWETAIQQLMQRLTRNVI